MIYFMDPVDGSDAGDGLTFATRWKTFTNGATAARIAPGDEIRYIASPDPTLVGNATWTDASRVVTLAAANTITIDNGEVAWTNAANVSGTTTTTRKQGATATNSVIASAFTTGKIAHRTLPAALDLSTMQQVSFWFKCSTTLSNSPFELRLCSDTAGDVAVNVIPIHLTSANVWQVITKDFGAPLGASIASVSLWAMVDPVTPTINIDNIIAAKASSAADSMTHLSLIGKKTTAEPEWYPILCIDGTSVELGGGTNSTQSISPPRPYSGVTETAATYKAQPIDLVNGSATPAGAPTLRVAQDSGSNELPIILSGGWNRADMSTKTGESWVTGAHYATAFFNLSGKNWWTVDNFGCAHFNGTNQTENSSTTYAIRARFVGMVGCSSTTMNGFAAGGYEFDYGNVVACERFWMYGTASRGAKLTMRRLTGCYSTGGALTIGAESNTTLHVRVGKVDNSAGSNVVLNTQNGQVIFYNLEASTIGADACNNVLLVNPVGTPTITGMSGADDVVRVAGYNGNATDHRHYSTYYTILTDSSIIHAASGYSWRLLPTNVRISSRMPVSLPLFTRSLAANVAATIKCWVRRDNLGLMAGIKINGSKVSGIPDDVEAWASGPVDTWEELTITVTPTAAGVIEVAALAYGGTTYNAWFDDWSVA